MVDDNEIVKEFQQVTLQVNHACGHAWTHNIRDTAMATLPSQWRKRLAQLPCLVCQIKGEPKPCP